MTAIPMCAKEIRLTPSLRFMVSGKIFCDSAPRHASPYRMSMTQPYPYWTLEAPFVTIVGLYSNVEGSLDARAAEAINSIFWRTALRSADPDKKLIATVPSSPFLPGFGPWRMSRYSERARSGSGRKQTAAGRRYLGPRSQLSAVLTQG